MAKAIVAPAPMVSRPYLWQSSFPLQIAAADRGEVGDSAVRAEGGEGLVLGPPVPGLDLVGLLELDLFLAADGAGVAGPHPDPVGVLHADGVDLCRVLEAAVPEVPGREVARRDAGVHGGPGPVLAQVRGAALELFDELTRQLPQPLGVGDLGGVVAPDGDALEPLRAHDGSHAAPAGDVV
jgi:hypothetical protein